MSIVYCTVTFRADHPVHRRAYSSNRGSVPRYNNMYYGHIVHRFADEGYIYINDEDPTGAQCVWVGLAGESRSFNAVIT